MTLVLTLIGLLVLSYMAAVMAAPADAISIAYCASTLLPVVLIAYAVGVFQGGRLPKDGRRGVFIVLAGTFVLALGLWYVALLRLAAVVSN